MYYTKKTQSSTRMFGLGAVLLVNGVALWVVLSGFGASIYQELTETQVAIIEVPEIEEDEPPPPPPVDVELPPPPPQVILPDFVFDQPPPPNAIRQVEITPQPARPAEVRPPPPPLPPVKPVADKDRFQQMMTEDYPARALRAKEEADVTVSMCVSVQGRASDVKLVKPSGNAQFDDATVKGIAKLRFTPAKDGQGKPTAWCTPPYVLTVSWRLPKG